MKLKTPYLTLIICTLVIGGFLTIYKVSAVEDDMAADHSMPDVCKVGQPGADTTSKDLIDRHAAALANYQRLEQLIRSTPDNDPSKGEISRQLEESRALESQLKTQIETTLGAGGPQGGPSDACKRAVVAKEKPNIQNIYSKIQSRFLPMMQQVNTLVTEVETNLPALKSSSQVTPDQITKIEADLATIKTESAVVTGMFEKAKNSFGTFLAKADSDPGAAFELIKNGQMSAGGNPKTAVDKLTAAFNDLKTVMTQIKEAANGTSAQ